LLTSAAGNGFSTENWIVVCFTSYG
jgi:hypothetical protein